jgi:8-oxo-dGTP pyrophosphatase MutT (NUDIX family)
VDELLDILDEAGLLTGRVASKSEAHRLGLWHRCFHCWISGSCPEGAYLLVQRRAPGKDTWPGYLDVTAAGHLAAGEETLDGLREVEEELGLCVEPERLIPLGSRRFETRIPGGFDREFHDVFLLLDSTPPENLRLQVEEVASVLRVDLDAVEAIYEAGTAAAREYTGGRIVPTQISLADFVPHDEDLRLVARAALRMLAGERPGRIF